MSSDYVRPETLSAALDLMARGTWTVAAGCTDLFPATERKTLPGPVLDITGIDGLRGIAPTPDGLRLGATTTWSDIVHADLPPAFTGLKRAAAEVGAVQIQNRGTLAGNLCNASPAADGMPPLLTLDAEVELARRGGTRRLPLSDFVQGPRRTVLEPDEIMTALHIPAEACRGRGHFLKLGARRHLVISIAMVAARVVEDAGRIAQVRLAVGSCGPVAVRLPELEASLLGQPVARARIDPALVTAALAPIDDIRADAAYRAETAAELLARALHDLAPERRAA